MSEPDYIVIYDPEFSDHGRWFDLEAMRDQAGIRPSPPKLDFDKVMTRTVRYGPTGMVDVRDDGVVAEVWMRMR